MRTAGLSLILHVAFFGGCAPKTSPTILAETPTTLVAPNANIYSMVLHQDQIAHAATKSQDRIRILENALKIDPASQFILTKLAEEYLKSNELDQAENKAKQALGICPACREPYSLLGKIYQQKRDPANAEKYYLKSLAMDEQDSGEDVLLLTTLYLNTQQVEKGVNILKSFIDRNPDNEMAYYYLGRAYSESNQIEKAIQTYNKIIDINPEFPHSYKALGLIYEYQNQTEKAVTYYSTALNLEPDNIELAKHVSMVYLDLKKYPEAKERLLQLIKLQPKDIESKTRLALLYLREENYAQAQKLLENVLKIDPRIDAVNYYMGIIEERNGNLSAGIKYLKAVSPTSTVFVDAQQSIAFILDTQGKLPQAKVSLLQALEKKPDQPALLALLAKIELKQKTPQSAIDRLERALVAHPKEELLWFTLGEIYDQAHNFAKSVQCFKQVIELNPNHASALNYLGFSYAEKGINLKEAETLIQRALRIKPKDGYIIDSLGWVYYKMGLFQDAVKQLREALLLIPNEPTILEHLGDSLLKLGEQDEAKKAYKLAFENSKEHVEKKRIENKLHIFKNR